MTEQAKLGDWAKDIKVSEGLPEGKGIIKAIHEPTQVETKYGKRWKCQVVIDGKDKSTINVGLFLPAQFPLLNPTCNLAKIMAQNGCKELKDLLGKEVEVIEIQEGFWKIKV